MRTASERMDFAIEHLRQAQLALYSATVEPDPVHQRRYMARAAEHCRKAADELDDEGRLA